MGKAPNGTVAMLYKMKKKLLRHGDIYWTKDQLVTVSKRLGNFRCKNYNVVTFIAITFIKLQVTYILVKSIILNI